MIKETIDQLVYYETSKKIVNQKISSHFKKDFSK